MKKLMVVVLMAGMVLFAGNAFGEPDLTGPWCVYSSEAYSSDGNDPCQYDYNNNQSFCTGQFVDPVTQEIFIDDQRVLEFGIGFYGHVQVSAVETTFFSGILVNKDVYFTHWDSATFGRLSHKRGQWIIEFINQAFDADNRSGKTSAGIAIEGPCPNSAE